MSTALLTHRLEGEGQPVVLLNGGMMSIAAWEPLAARLRQRYRVLRFDFRGQLLSPGDGPNDLAGHADDLAALLDALQLPAAHLVGASFGAEVAIELAARGPQRVRSLLAATAMDRSTESFRQGSEELRRVVAAVLAGEDRGAFHDAVVEGVYSASYREAHREELALRRGQLSRLPDGWFRGVDRLLACIEAFDLVERLPAVRCPSLVVVAGADKVMERRRSEALAAAIGAELLVHPRAGHALVAEDPEWFAGACLTFLDRCSRSQS